MWQQGHCFDVCVWCAQVTDWFTGKLGYQYDPVMHGTASEWLSDLISISFNEPPKYFKKSMRSLQVTWPQTHPVKGPCATLGKKHAWLLMLDTGVQ